MPAACPDVVRPTRSTQCHQQRNAHQQHGCWDQKMAIRKNSLPKPHAAPLYTSRHKWLMEAASDSDVYCSSLSRSGKLLSVGFEMPSIQERVASLEADLKSYVKMGGAFISLILLAWLAVVTVKLSSIAEDVRGMKQALNDKGVHVVQQIQNSNDPLTQRAALLAAAVDIKDAQKSERKPDTAKVADVTRALQEVASRQNAPQEVWPAVATLVNYKSSIHPDAPPTNQQTCEGRFIQSSTNATLPSPIDKKLFGYRFDATNCTFDLNDVEQIEKLRSLWKAKESGSGLSNNLFVNLVGVTLKYDPNKPLVKLSYLSCLACRLQVAEPVQQPSLPDRNLLLALLKTDGSALMLNNLG